MELGWNIPLQGRLYRPCTGHQQGVWESMWPRGNLPERSKRPSSGVLGGCRCSSGGPPSPFFKGKQLGNTRFCPHKRVQRKLQGFLKINSCFKNKRQACGHFQRQSPYSQGWKAELQRPNIRQKA